MDGDRDALISPEEPDVPLTGKSDHVRRTLSDQGSSYSESNGSELSLSRSQLKGISGRPKKRKAHDENTPRSRLKRLRGHYNNNYRNLLNNTIDDITKKTISGELKPLGASQIGITEWSVKEKELFFRALTTKGKDDLLGIAAMIGTKNELEVHVYLQLLQKARKEHHLYDRRQQLLGISDVVGAFEVSKDCCDALDLAADALGVLQEEKEHESEIEKYGELRLLDATAAKWVEDHLHKGKDGESEVLQVLPAATVLNLGYYLELSSRLFMNSNDPEYNWRSYSGRDESPSILYSAFSDIQDIAVSVTRRLIQSTLFFATSRLRATSSSTYTHRLHVRRRDVTAALSVLGMKYDAKSYWTGVAKRCSLDVYEDPKRRTVEGERLNYDEIERRLNEPRKYKLKSGAITPQENDLASQTPLHEDDSSVSDYLSEDISKVTASPDDADLSHTSCESHALAQEHLEQDQDAYVNAIDLKASQYEEQRLWKILGQKAPETVKPWEIELPKRSGPSRISREDLDDWRSWVDYVGEWEAHDKPVSASDFAATQKKFRNRRSRAASVLPVRGSELAGRTNGDSDNNDDGTSGNLEMPGRMHEMSPATSVEDHSEKGADELKDQDEDTEKADEKQDQTDSVLDSTSVSEDRDFASFGTGELEKLMSSDSDVDSDVQSRLASSADE